MTLQKKNLQVGVIATGVILCLNDSIGEVGEAMGEFIGKNVILGLGLCIGRKGEDGIDGGREELFEEENEVAGDIVLRLADQHKGVAIREKIAFIFINRVFFVDTAWNIRIS